MGLRSVFVSEDRIDEGVEALLSRSPLARIDKNGPHLVVCEQVIAKHCVLGSVHIVSEWERKGSETAASKLETECGTRTAWSAGPHAQENLQTRQQAARAGQKSVLVDRRSQKQHLLRDLPSLKSLTPVGRWTSESL
jgi:hypothetical protein